MDRLAKKAFVDHFREEVFGSPYMLVVTHSGLRAGSIADFRKQVRSVGGTFKVVKNTLAKKALGNQSEFAEVFSFPTAVLLSNDAVSLSKVSVDFAKQQKEGFKIMLGRLDGVMLSEREIVELSSLPSMEGLRAKLLRVLNGAAGQLLTVLQAPARGVVTVLDAHHKNSVCE